MIRDIMFVVSEIYFFYIDCLKLHRSFAHSFSLYFSLSYVSNDACSVHIHVNDFGLQF